MKQLVAVIMALPLVFACSTEIARSTVADAERARADAIARNDTAAYGRLVAPDLVMIDGTGELVTKGDRMAAVDSGRARNARRVEGDVEIRRYGNMALVVGRAALQDDGQQHHDYFTRIWVQHDGRLEMVGAHYTDITRQVDDDDPSNTVAPDHPVVPLPIGTDAPVANANEDVQRVIDEQHQAYWRKDPDRYRLYAGTDLLRVAENGIRSREQLIAGMRGNSRLPAPPSDRLDTRVRLFGNTAVATWLDQGTDLLGRPTQNRFTVIFAYRDRRWQMVHIQSTGLKRS